MYPYEMAIKDRRWPLMYNYVVDGVFIKLPGLPNRGMLCGCMIM